MRLFEGLDLGIAVPELPVDLVAANVEIGVGKELSHLLNELVHEFVSLFTRRIGDGRRSRLRLNREGAFTARQLGITGEPRAAVARGIELRDHTDGAIMR